MIFCPTKEVSIKANFDKKKCQVLEKLRFFFRNPITSNGIDTCNFGFRRIIVGIKLARFSKYVQTLYLHDELFLDFFFVEMCFCSSFNLVG